MPESSAKPLHCSRCGKETPGGYWAYGMPVCFVCALEETQTKAPEQQKQEPATRHDFGKPRYDLLPPDALDELVQVYNVGLAKYTERNWEKGMAWGRVVGSLLRHAFAWMSGQDRDPESGLHHMAHVAWNALTLVAYAKRKVGTDDRAKAGGEG